MPVIAAVDDLAQAILFESEAKADRMQAVIDRKKKLNMTDTTLPSGLPAHVGVLGGGRMGAGIAHAFLVSGSEVTVVEANPDAADAASRLTVTSDVADFPDAAWSSRPRPRTWASRPPHWRAPRSSARTPG